MSQAVSKQEASKQQIQQQRQAAGSREVQEHHASANASAGLNLNLFGALSGAFSSKQKKTTHQNADGSATMEEERRDKGTASAAAGGRGSAYAAGNAQQSSLKAKESGVGKESLQGKSVKQVDHLGIEG